MGRGGADAIINLGNSPGEQIADGVLAAKHTMIGSAINTQLESSNNGK